MACVVELQSRLDLESAWRKKELSQARILAESAQNAESARYLCRAWVLMMYAHCDNYLKQSGKIYTDFLIENGSSHYRRDLIWLAASGWKNITEGATDKYVGIGDFSSLPIDLAISSAVERSSFQSMSFSYKQLRFLCDWVMQIEFEHVNFKEFCDTLKRKRDSIAHGEFAYVELEEDCLPWHLKTFVLFDELKDNILSRALESDRL